MKSLNWIFTALTATTLLLAGCSKTEPAPLVDATPITKSFEKAEPTLKAAAEKTIALIKEGNYPGALQELQKLGTAAKLTEEQKKAITDVIANVQKAITSAVGTATKEAGKALDNVQKSLGK